MAEVTYYFDTSASYFWETNPEHMYDGSLTTFASANKKGDNQHLKHNTCLGIDLGAITKVELRVYGYGDGDDRIGLTPFELDTEYLVTMPVAEDWSAYVNITNDPSAPSPWTWLDVKNLTLAHGYYQGVAFRSVGKANTIYCAKVEIRVTYTPEAPPEYIPKHSGTVGVLII